MNLQQKLQDLEPDDNDEVICREPKRQREIVIVPIERIIINLFSAQRYLTELFRSREKVLTQARDGKYSYYTFTYPGLGWVQYDHNSINYLFRLAASKNPQDLATIHQNKKNSVSIRLHAIAALLIQKQGEITKLYDGARRARDSAYKQKVTVVFFSNPFRNIFYSNKNNIMLNGKEVIVYQNIGHRLKFQPFLPLIKDRDVDDGGIKVAESVIKEQV